MSIYSVGYYGSRPFKSRAGGLLRIGLWETGSIKYVTMFDRTFTAYIRESEEGSG